jgi:aldehyde:ferredoxin oxidoreductase
MSGADGYAGKILRIDLSSRKSETIPTRLFTERFLGGRGIGAKIYWDEVPPEIGAFDPENRLIFITGPVTATTGFAGARWQICGKSPLNERFGYANVGGAWGAQLKMAGYDGLIVSGKADGPSRLMISEDGAEISKADHLWGEDAISCRDRLKQELGKAVRVLAVGPAGEKGVVFSTLLADNDSSGSSGFGAVMGAKNLKAICVHGRQKVPVARKETIQSLKEEIRRFSNIVADFWFTMIPGQKDNKKQICYGCGGGCFRNVYSSRSGRKGKFMCQSSLFYMFPALAHYGQLNEVPFEANKLCDEYGLDTFATEGMVEWLINCHEEGALTEEQTGLPLSKIGSLEFIETLIKKVATREGIGDLLAEGARKAAEALGPEAKRMIKDSMTRTGSKYYYGPRMWITTGFFYAMEPRTPIQQLHGVILPAGIALLREGGLVETGPNIGELREIAKRFWGSELAVDYSTYEGKSLAARKIQDRAYAKECLILCDFRFPILYTGLAGDPIGDPALESRICSAVTGRDVDEKGLYRIGERVFNLQRAIMVREGHRGRKDDVLMDCDYEMPLPSQVESPECLVPGKDGQLFSRKGFVIERDRFEKIKDEYYDLRGWDVATGLQTATNLKALDLEDVFEVMSVPLASATDS